MKLFQTKETASKQTVRLSGEHAGSLRNAAQQLINSDLKGLNAAIEEGPPACPKVAGAKPRRGTSLVGEVAAEMKPPGSLPAQSSLLSNRPATSQYESPLGLISDLPL